MVVPTVQGTLKDAVAVPVEDQRPILQQESTGPGNAGVIISLLSGLLGDMVTGSITEQFNISKSHTETKDGATTTMSTEMGRNADGTTVFQMGMKTEKTVDGKRVKIEFDSKVDGTRCPNAAGQVSFTVKTRTSAYSGKSGYTQDLISHVRAEVDDNAEIVKTTIDVEQATRQVKDGREIYIETATTFKHAGEEVRGSEESNFRVVRASSKAKSSDQSVSNDGLISAWIMGEVSLMMAKEKWMNGACVKIEAKSPGLVEVSSVTEIPVKVMHIFEGGEVKSKLTAELSGKESVDPTKLAQTPGTIKYTAPNERGKSATILLTATSKRGKAKLELNANTGGAAYLIVGGLDDWQTSTAVCDIMQPFALTSPILTLNFSGGLSGTYSYSGGPFNATGGSSYSISLPEGIGKPGSMTGGGTGCVDTPLGTQCNSGTEQYTLTPLEPDATCTQ